MSQTVTKTPLSASTNGRRIKVGATATPGTLVHTASTNVGDVDDVYLDVMNNHTAAVDVTVQFGGTTDPDDTIFYAQVPPKTSMKGLVPLCRGLLAGAATALEVRVFASVANVVTIGGDVCRGVAS